MDISIYLWSSIVALCVYIFFKWGTSTYSHFAERKVIHIKPSPFVGNLGKLFTGRENFISLTKRLYNQFKHEKFYGLYSIRRPILIISEPEVIKQVTVKDFEHFLDHRAMLSGASEPLFIRNLASLTGQKWKDMRATLSPAFTGSKMREMFELVIECGDRTMQFLRTSANEMPDFVIDTKDIATRYTNDVIASAAFGLQVNSLEDKENDFFKMGRALTEFSRKRSLKVSIIANLPWLSNILDLHVFDQTVCNKFRQIVTDAMEYRTKNSIVRRDMIQLLMQTQQGTLQHGTENDAQLNEGFATAKESPVGLSKSSKSSNKWEIDDLVAQCLIFFFAGFDTSSVLMCFCVQELIENPDVQETLRNEVDDVNAELNGAPLSYDVLQKMKYMDMVITETLRKWPPAAVTDRVCVKPYTFNNNGHKIPVAVKEVIMIPIAGIHHDPEYYPNPDKFDPERFSEQNKSNIRPFTYLPFGAGPRNCIGSRFALMESKAFIFQLLTNFTLEVSEKTQIPIKLAKAGLFLRPEKGFWALLKPRNS